MSYSIKTPPSMRQSQRETLHLSAYVPEGILHVQYDLLVSAHMRYARTYVT